MIKLIPSLLALGAGFTSLATLTVFDASGASAPAVSADVEATSFPEFDEHSGEYKIDGVHSSLIFAVKHAGLAPFRGRFNSMGGELVLDEDPAECSLLVEIQMGSVDTANSGRDKHLRGPDFFNAVQFPVAIFESQSITKDGDVYKAVGQLTAHGKTHEETLEFTFTGGGESRGGHKVGFDGKLVFDRTDFGIGNQPEGSLGHEITLLIGIEAASK